MKKFTKVQIEWILKCADEVFKMYPLGLDSRDVEEKVIQDIKEM